MSVLEAAQHLLAAGKQHLTDGFRELMLRGARLPRASSPDFLPLAQPHGFACAPVLRLRF